MDIREIMRSNSSSQQLFIVSAQDLKNAIGCINPAGYTRVKGGCIEK